MALVKGMQYETKFNRSGVFYVQVEEIIKGAVLGGLRILVACDDIVATNAMCCYLQKVCAPFECNIVSTKYKDVEKVMKLHDFVIGISTHLEKPHVVYIGCVALNKSNCFVLQRIMNLTYGVYYPVRKPTNSYMYRLMCNSREQYNKVRFYTNMWEEEQYPVNIDKDEGRIGHVVQNGVGLVKRRLVSSYSNMIDLKYILQYLYCGNEVFMLFQNETTQLLDIRRMVITDINDDKQTFTVASEDDDMHDTSIKWSHCGIDYFVSFDDADKVCEEANAFIKYGSHVELALG
jgi:hypothetical protein